MAVKEILLLGNPVLRTPCGVVHSIRSAATATAIRDLRDTLRSFRRKRGFGRGIAAPQIGIQRRIVYLDCEFRGALINPQIVRRSRKTFHLWDDCFSFPDLIVRVRRASSIVVSYIDEAGTRKLLNSDGAFSELLQHEIDHLDGILAIDRAIDSRHIILRSEYDKLKSHPSFVL
jgi:peptide deformylase